MKSGSRHDDDRIGCLKHVSEEHDTCPMASFDALASLDPKARTRVIDRHGPTPSKDILRDLSSGLLAGLTFEAIEKMRASSVRPMSIDMEEMMANDHDHILMHRIRNSMWHWDSHRPAWNETVDAAKGIHAFSIDVPGFTANLVHADGTGTNGAAENEDVWLDGSFAYVVRHGGRHAMTIGFSFAGKRRVLIQQVQAASKQGNRWMFRFPRNRMEHVVSCFARAFPNHEILIIDGEAMARRNLVNYAGGLRQADESIAVLDRVAKRSRVVTPAAARMRALAVERRDATAAAMSALEGDVPRLKSLYSDCGRHVLLETCIFAGAEHWRIDPHRIDDAGVAA